MPVLRTIGLWAPLAVYMAVIFALSSMSNVPAAPTGMDKVVHLVLYIGLAVTVLRAVAGGLPVRVSWRPALAAVAITVAYGATDELHQRFVPLRSADAMDLVADGCGAVVGTIGCWAWGILASRNHEL